MAGEFAKLLLDWYDAHARVLPWRGIRNPYCTWVSETMLQQTRVETVLRYYPRFIERFPTVEALAAAPEADVLKMWEGLGYYRRARNLHKGAKQVAEDMQGVIPHDVKALKTISGIGDYTAGAIASIAYDQPVPAVDGNVIRVISRVMGVRENVGVPSVKRQIEAHAASLVDDARPGDFNQAMMDLGATICVPGTPSCDRCPVCTLCDAYHAGDAEELPELPRKNPPKVIHYDLCLVIGENRVLMRQRTETMLQGLWVFPMTEEHHTMKQLQAMVKKRMGATVENLRFLGEAKHVFTHQVWQMKIYAMDTASGKAPEGWRYVTLEEMGQLTIPTAVKKAVEHVQMLLQA